MKYLIIILSITLMACSKKEEIKKIPEEVSFATGINIPKEYREYYNSFKEAVLSSNTLDENLKHRLNTVKIRNVLHDDEIAINYHAICLPETNTIVIDPKTLTNFNELKMQQLIDHELGHCVLLRSHHNVSTLTNFGEIPSDAMHRTIFGYNSEENMHELRQGLFNKKYYGTLTDLMKVFKEVPHNQHEITFVNGFPTNMQYVAQHELIRLEHKVMAQREEDIQNGKF